MCTVFDATSARPLCFSTPVGAAGVLGEDVGEAEDGEVLGEVGEAHGRPGVRDGRAARGGRVSGRS